MLDAFIGFFTHPAFTAIAGFIVGHVWAINRDKRREFIVAGEELRKVFNQFLVDLRGWYYSFGSPISETIINAHRVACLNFRPHLRGVCQDQYDDACEEYFDHCRKLGSLFDYTRLTRKEIEQDIIYILEFTKKNMFWRILWLMVWVRIKDPFQLHLP